MQPQFPKPEPTTRWLTQELQAVKAMIYGALVFTVLNTIMLAYDTDVVYHIDQVIHAL